MHCAVVLARNLKVVSLAYILFFSEFLLFWALLVFTNTRQAYSSYSRKPRTALGLLCNITQLHLQSLTDFSVTDNAAKMWIIGQLEKANRDGKTNFIVSKSAYTAENLFTDFHTVLCSIKIKCTLNFVMAWGCRCALCSPIMQPNVRCSLSRTADTAHVWPWFLPLSQYRLCCTKSVWSFIHFMLIWQTYVVPSSTNLVGVHGSG